MLQMSPLRPQTHKELEKTKMRKGEGQDDLFLGDHRVHHNLRKSCALVPQTPGLGPSPVSLNEKWSPLDPEPREKF
jgi:hypothetical protein